jgi:hypothetical protein
VAAAAIRVDRVPEAERRPRHLVDDPLGAHMQEFHAAELAAARFPLEHRLVEQGPLRLWPIGLTPPQLLHLADYNEHMYA